MPRYTTFERANCLAECVKHELVSLPAAAFSAALGWRCASTTVLPPFHLPTLTSNRPQPTHSVVPPVQSQAARPTPCYPQALVVTRDEAE